MPRPSPPSNRTLRTLDAIASGIIHIHRNVASIIEEDPVRTFNVLFISLLLLLLFWIWVYLFLI